ncbi:MAG: hypothetical protein QXN55_01075 [Candidatus Nitrosotenuis sp.]
MSLDFSGIISGTGVDLERTAAAVFGQAVDIYANQQINRVFNGPTTGTVESHNPPQHGYWDPASYAEDLITFQPKHRFLFKVMFDVDPAFINLFKDHSGQSSFQYVVKTIQRPTITYEYEDVNFYNFRTKFLKSIKHGELQLTLIDDIQNTLHVFLGEYIRAFSPINRSAPPASPIMYDTAGFNFTNPAAVGQVDSAVRGVLKKTQSDNSINPLKSIKIIQFFGHAAWYNTFTLINPRVTTINYDDASHEGGDPGNHVTINFDYDALYMDQTIDFVGTPPYPAPKSDIYGSITDRSGNIGSLKDGYDPVTGRPTSALGVAQNIFGTMLGNVSARIASNAIQRVTQGILGSSNPMVAGVLGNLGYGVSSQVADMARRTVGNTVNGVSPGFIAPNRPAVVDSGAIGQNTTQRYNGLF